MSLSRFVEVAALAAIFGLFAILSLCLPTPFAVFGLACCAIGFWEELR